MAKSFKQEVRFVLHLQEIRQFFSFDDRRFKICKNWLVRVFKRFGLDRRLKRSDTQILADDSRRVFVPGVFARIRSLRIYFVHLIFSRIRVADIFAVIQASVKENIRDGNDLVRFLQLALGL